ncbi:HTH-type transcriptional regulatory protein GabR [Stieleria maiorica]|uniref:HTH-type transcriptional regulatory protein GabR n=1 Tax=Stieleria maiorica TaxID=2795974 RepID=A0A5B9MFP5_9BACT|nr:PLP-dependent aminotransferase family protein [Stieleria maiorica]QEF97937.1 HTH-type transcriptional regulatory protein GabR [Stieleria maiorica]
MVIQRDHFAEVMSRRRNEQFEFESIQLIPDSATPVYQQLEHHLRQAIADRTLRPDDRVPSSRNLATAIGVSRNTVLAAYDQLISEGYLESVRGSGTRVAKMPPQAFEFDATTSPVAPQMNPVECLSPLGRQFCDESRWMPTMTAAPKAFTPHLPAIDEFPLEIWNRFRNEQARWSRRHLCVGDPQGYQPLRESIAQYMAVSRGLSCHADQVVITSGSQQAVTLISQLLLERDDAVWVEEPGNAPANRLLEIAGARLIPLPLDSQGIDLSRVPKNTAPPKLICVTPGGQWPMGMTMSLNRRLELIAAAQRHKSWIVEDDYNGEFRYAGRPHASLSSLDSSGRTIYMGTFSKMLYPAIRLGFLIVPADLAKTFAYARFLQDRASPPLVQMVLHRFIESGNFVKHIRRMRALYCERQTVLLETLDKHLAGYVGVEQPESGMHLVARGVTKAAETKLIAAANRAKVEFHPVSMYSRNGDAPGMILGFAAFDKESIRRAVRRWAKELQK